VTSPVERFLESQRRLDAAPPLDAHRSRLRFVGLTLAFAPMLAVGLLPLTVAAGVLAQLVARVTYDGAGLVFLVLLYLAGGAMLAKSAFRSEPDRPGRGWRREVVAGGLTVAIVAAGVTEVVSGSRAPDPLLPMWFVTFAWLFVFVPRALGPWRWWQRTLWIAGPLVTACTIVFVWTAGFFTYRFERSLPELQDYVSTLDAGGRYRAGTVVGEFEIRARGRLPGCRAAFRIEGWHESDDRWIAWCPDGEPEGSGIDRLAGDWYEYQNP
jgi:hypothetical protein